MRKFRFLPRLGFLLVLILGGCREGYDTASCEKGCTREYNMCLSAALFYGRTPAEERAPGSLLLLGCLSDQTACKNSCQGFQSRE